MREYIHWHCFPRYQFIRKTKRPALQGANCVYRSDGHSCTGILPTFDGVCPQILPGINRACLILWTDELFYCIHQMVLRQNSGTAPFHNCKPFSFKGFQLLRFDLHGNVKRNIRKEQLSRSFYSYYSIESHEMQWRKKKIIMSFQCGR